MMTGTLFAVGVGPGDPELLTLKAVKTLRAADVVACPAKGVQPGFAYRIAEQACPEITEKERLLLSFPMKKGDWNEAHEAAAAAIIERLKIGMNVALLTLGEPAFYSTAFYVLAIVQKAGYAVEVVNGIPSFCAASARLLLPLAAGDDAVLITPGTFRNFDGTQVILKVGSNLKTLKEQVAASGKTAYLVENCATAEEKVYTGIDAIPDETGYYSLMIVK